MIDNRLVKTVMLGMIDGNRPELKGDQLGSGVTTSTTGAIAT